VERGDWSAANVSDASRRAATAGVDGVMATDCAAGLNDLREGIGVLARTASPGGAAPKCS